MDSSSQCYSRMIRIIRNEYLTYFSFGPCPWLLNEKKDNGNTHAIFGQATDKNIYQDYGGIETSLSHQITKAEVKAETLRP